MFRVGSKVRVSDDNDNDGYNSFRGKTLRVTHVAKDKTEHPGYDSGMSPQRLYDLEDMQGNPIGCSLYDYELQRV